MQNLVLSPLALSQPQNPSPPPQNNGPHALPHKHTQRLDVPSAFPFIGPPHAHSQSAPSLPILYPPGTHVPVGATGTALTRGQTPPAHTESPVSSQPQAGQTSIFLSPPAKLDTTEQSRFSLASVFQFFVFGMGAVYVARCTCSFSVTTASYAVVFHSYSSAHAVRQGTVPVEYA